MFKMNRLVFKPNGLPSQAAHIGCSLSHVHLAVHGDRDLNLNGE